MTNKYPISFPANLILHFQSNYCHLLNIIFISNLILCQFLFSQDNIKFQQLSIEDGLSQITINCIFQDSKGFMWFGTQDGLNKYDGYNFKIYKHHPLDSNTISHNWIWDVFEDKYGKIWIATWFGLNRMDPFTEKITRFFPDKNKRHTLSNTRPVSIKADKNGDLWIATWGGGINHYNFDSEEFYAYQHDSDNKNSINSNFARTMYFDSKGILWIGTWNGLCYITQDSIKNKSQTKFIRLLSKPDTPNNINNCKVISIVEDKSGQIWVGTWLNGVYKIDVNKKNIIQYKHNANNPSSISSNRISAIYEDSFAKLWISTQNEGLNYYLPKQDGFARYQTDESNKNSLSSNLLTTLLEDISGILWIGTAPSGLNKLNLNRKKFFYFSHSNNKKNSLSSDLVRCIFQDNRGYLWIGTKNRGLNRYNFRTKKFKRYRHDPENPFSISHDYIQNIVGDKTGCLWIATFGGGINRYDPESDKFFHYKHNPNSDQSISSNDIETLLLDRNDNLWIGNSDQGLDAYNLNSKRFEHFKYDINDSNSISISNILSIFEDSYGYIWIGGWGNGLNRYNTEKNTFKRFLHNPSDPQSLCDDIVNSIYETHSNGKSTLWVGTSGGISYMGMDELSIGKFKHYFEKDGLPNHHIYGIMEDNSKNLWLSTNKGLSKFTPPVTFFQKVAQSGLFKNYDSKDGLLFDEFTGGSYYRGKDGHLYFGCSKGLVFFNPDSIKNNFSIPPVVITNFQLYDESDSETDGETYLYKKKMLVKDKINLSYRNNFFSIEFAALDFSASEKNKYAFKMEGFSKDWIYTDAKNRMVTYTNLEPGEYTFRVKGSNGDGIWNERGASVDIIITPPWWKTWWFYTLLFLLISGVITLLIMYRVRQILKIKTIEKMAEEKMRSKVAADFHDELGNRITKISLFSEILKGDIYKTSEKTMKYLNKINENANNLYNETRDFIWHLDPQKDTLHDLAVRLKIFGDELFDGTDTNFAFNGISDNLKNIRLQMDWRQHILRIFKEAMHNVLKYAASKNVLLTISIKEKNVILELSDDGRGFDLSEKFEGEGLKNMRNRSTEIQADLTIHSEPGKGTVIRLIFNLP